MKKTIHFASVLMAAAALFAGCQKVEEQMNGEIVNAPVDLTETIVATYSAPTRVVDSENGLVWEEEESIAVSMRGHDFIPYCMVQLDESRKTAWFRTDARADDANPFMDRNIAFSPLQEDAAIDAAEGAISHILPAVQEYSADGFLGRFFPMAAVTEHGYDTEFAFKNICGVLVLQLTGAGDQVETIILRGNNKEPLYGAAVTKVSADNAPVIASLDPGYVKEYGLTLDCSGSEVILGEEATKFWFVIPPTTFEKGITVEVITTDGYHDFISTENEVAVGRSEELVMDPVEKQPKPQYPAMILEAEAEGNLVHLSWTLDEQEHPSETPRNPGDDTVGIEKTILTFRSREIEIPAGMTDTTLVLFPEEDYYFEMVNIPADTMKYKPSAVATASAVTSYFSITDLRSHIDAANEDKTAEQISLSAYAGRQYKGVISLDDQYVLQPLVGVMDESGNAAGKGIVVDQDVRIITLNPLTGINCTIALTEESVSSQLGTISHVEFNYVYTPEPQEVTPIDITEEKLGYEYAGLNVCLNGTPVEKPVLEGDVFMFGNARIVIPEFAGDMFMSKLEEALQEGKVRGMCGEYEGKPALWPVVLQIFIENTPPEAN